MISEKRSGQLVAHEYIPIESWHYSSEGHYATELVVSCVRSDLVVSAKKTDIKHDIRPLVGPSVFLRPPGSDWLYMCLGCGKHIHDEIITHAAEMARRLTQTGFLNNWFFIRYSHPHDQLRLRFQVDREHLYSDVLREVCKWASELVYSGLCLEYSFETYDREVERFGGPDGINLAENLFGADSANVAGILSLPKCASESGSGSGAEGLMSV